VRAAAGVGLEYELVDFEMLVDELRFAGAVRRVRSVAVPETAVYRGWMLTPLQYTRLYSALEDRNIILINTPEQYRPCHYLPDSYSVIEQQTPRTVSIPYDDGFSMDRVVDMLRSFGNKPIVLKDYVKSRKHEWKEACFIPSASDRGAVERVVVRFLELQGEDLNEGLVFREFVEFQPLTEHSRSVMPLTKEFRQVFLNGERICSLEYWDEGDYAGVVPGAELFVDVAKQVNSSFFTMDVAQTKDGRWMIVELGDGQVAGLPEKTDVLQFYRKLKKGIERLGWKGSES